MGEAAAGSKVWDGGGRRRRVVVGVLDYQVRDLGLFVT